MLTCILKLLTRLHETHFGPNVNSMVDSPMEVSLLSPDQQPHLTAISTSNDGRTVKGLERGKRSVVGGAEESLGDGGYCVGGVHHLNQDGGVHHHHNFSSSVPHSQLEKVRLFPLGPAAPIDKMPHVQFRSHNLHVTPFIFLVVSFSRCELFRPNGTIFDCELGCFVPIEEYHRRRSKESLLSVKEGKEEENCGEGEKEGENYEKLKEEEKREKL